MCERPDSRRRGQGRAPRVGAPARPARQGLAVLAAVIGLLLILWAGDNSYRYSLMQTAAAYALIGVGVYIPFIMGGSLSLAYAAYASIGGYSVALIADKTSLPVLIGWIIGPIVAGFAAVVLGQLTRRLSGLYLAAITYLFAQAFQSWLNSAPGHHRRRVRHQQPPPTPVRVDPRPPRPDRARRRPRPRSWASSSTGCA